MSPRRGARGLGSSIPRAALVGVAVAVVLLVALDVVLVGFALGRTAPAANGTPGPIPTYTSTPDAVAGSATPSATATAPASTGATARHLISAVDGLEAWRASTASCSVAKAVLQRSTDGGQTWQPVAVDDDVRTITGLRASASGIAILAGVGTDCDPVVRTSADDGATWTDGTAGAAGAGVTADGIVLGDTVERTPCPEPVDAFRGDRTTVVVCDGQVEWRDGTDAWVDIPLGGVRAVAVNGDRYTFARVGTDSCAGVQIETMSAVGVTPESTTTPVGCDDHAPTTGSIALDRAGQDVWMWTADGVAVSTDGGATW